MATVIQEALQAAPMRQRQRVLRRERAASPARRPRKKGRARRWARRPP
jgi:hypothetical protein